MDAKSYALFLEKMGHHVVCTTSSYWYDVSRFSYLAFPFHRTLILESDEKKDLWRKTKSIAVRFSSPEESPSGRSSYRVVCRNKNYDLYSLSKKARNQTRRGLENCKIQNVDFVFLAEKGFDLYQSTLERQGRKISKKLERYWIRYCQEAGKTKGFEAWGAFVNGDLAAYIVALQIDGCYNVFIQRSAQHYLSSYPNNALVYFVTREVLSRSNIEEISFGLEPLQTTLSSLEHFKISMGYSKYPIKQQVIFRPSWQPLINMTSHLLLNLAKRFQKIEFFRKLDGMIRFSQSSKS